MRTIRLFAVLLAAAVLSGCSKLYARDVYEETRHIERPYGAADPSDLEASNESELKTAILSLIRSGSTAGVIKLTNYQGEAMRDILNAVADISNEPLGRYAVYYFPTPEVTNVSGGYHASISIIYRRPVEEIKKLVQASGREGIKSLIEDAMREFKPTLTVEMTYYDGVEYAPDSLVREAYYENPGYALGYPGVNVVLYPEEDKLGRIIEVNFTYDESAETLSERAVEVAAAADELLDGMSDGLSPEMQVAYLYEALSERTEFDDEDSATVYGALIEGRAAGEGFALAYKLLCDNADIPCKIITGTRGTNEHVWNLVEINGLWYHTDASSDSTRLLKADADMENYHWLDTGYPARADVSFLFE